MTVDLQTVLETAMLAARTGGQLAVSRVGNPGSEKHKGPRDVVTSAVLDVQTVIVEIIRAQFPDHQFLLEESDSPVDDRTTGPLWIVDPIDGSLNFLHGVPIFAVSIAFRDAGRYKVGVVYDPNRDEMFHAIAGQGAYLNGRSIQVDAFSDGREAWERTLIGTDWGGSDDQMRLALRLARYVATQTFQLVSLGSPALGLCYVAAGRFHAYYGLDTLKLWDVAAGFVILKEAGGIMTDAQGASWEHAEQGYLVSNNVVHGWLNRIVMTVLSLPGGEPTQRRDGDAGS